MAMPWEVERPEDCKDPVDMLTRHFDFGQSEAEKLQKKRNFSLEDLREWFRYRRVAFKAEGVKCPSSYVQWKMREFNRPDQTRDPWWQRKGLQKEKKLLYEQPYKPKKDPEAMSWQQFRATTGRSYMGGKKKSAEHTEKHREPDRLGRPSKASHEAPRVPSEGDTRQSPG